jgi:two-component system, cell cycle sensor histidine kinase and response regulator CckA
LIAALGLIVVAQSAALVALAGARQRACRRVDEHVRRQAEAGALAHDFTNLLAVILNYSSFVLEILAGTTLAVGTSPRSAARRRRPVRSAMRCSSSPVARRRAARTDSTTPRLA